MPLPLLPPAFRWTTEPWGAALVCDPLAAVVPHLFTTRALTLRVGPGAGSPHEEGWDAVAASMGVTEDRLLRLRQVHGKAVITVRRGTAPPPVDEAPEADAFVSDDPGCALAVRGADCVPLLLADRRTGAVAAVHAGWRGTAAGAAAAAVSALWRTFGTRPADLVAAVGPSIGPCCYQVGDELVEAFLLAGHAPARVEAWFAREAGLRLDLWAATRDQLVDAGLDPAQIYLCGLCVACHPEQCFSFRCEGAGTGRLAGVIRARPR